MDELEENIDSLIKEHNRFHNECFLDNPYSDHTHNSEVMLTDLRHLKKIIGDIK